MPGNKGGNAMHMTTSEFWSGLSDLLAQADSHPIDSRDEDSGDLHRDRDAYLVREHLEIGKPLWPLIERDISRDPALGAKLRHACEIREAGRGPLNGTSKEDIHGRKYARIDSLRAGCLVQFDDGHGCMPDRAVRQVKCDPVGEFYVECSCGKHLLLDDEGILVGVYPMGNKEPTVRFEGKDMPASEWLAQVNPMDNKEPIVHFKGKDMTASEWLAQIARCKRAS
jgi:hypothetical protein